MFKETLWYNLSFVFLGVLKLNVNAKILNICKLALCSMFTAWHSASLQAVLSQMFS